MMYTHIAIFGANGRVGRLVVSEALTRGYAVTAFVHRHANFDDDPRLTIVRGDIHNEDDVRQALARADVVISTLGSWGTKQKDILSAGMRSIIPATQSAGIDRIISLTGADARAAGDTLSIIHRLSHAAISLIAGKILSDGETHIKLLENSQLDWTVIRSPIMTTKNAASYTFTHTRPLPWTTIPRRSVVLALLAELDHDHHSQQALFIK